MKNIFISYRREDSEGFARGLFQSLVSAFGPDHVFMDVEAIGLGTDFVEAIDKSLAGCGALLVLIGKGWSTCTDASGRRRLDDPQDFVRMEVAKALEQKVRVIPVLVKGAKMPAAEDLPEELRTVSRRQALELRHERWNQDVAHLVTELAKLLGLPRLDQQEVSSPPPAPAKKSGRRVVLGVAAVLVLAILGIGGYALLSTNPPTPPVARTDAQQATAPAPDPPPPKASIAPPKEEATKVTPAPAPKSAPKTQETINLTGMWVDAEGVNVQIAQQGSEVRSKAYNPLTGLAVEAVWHVSGRKIAFNWMSSDGSKGYGEGSIAADANTVDYRFVDQMTGEKGYGRLYRRLN